MENKINNVFLVEYCKDLSKKLIESKLQDKEFVTGKDVVNFCAIPQVNYFILRNLFKKWLEERQKLRVPFFDYASPEVQKALQVYLDTLSHHIKLNKELFQKLLETSVYDTVELVLTPFKFFKNKVIEVKEGKVFRSDLEKELKYFKYNKVVLQDLLAEMSKFPLESVNGEDTYNTLHNIIQRDETKLYSPKQLVEELNELLKVELYELIIDYSENRERMLVVPDSNVEMGNSLNEKFKKEPMKVLHDTLSSVKKGQDLFEIMSIGEQYFFAKELFGNNMGELKEASHQLKSFQSEEEAQKYLWGNYAERFEWEKREEAEVQFLHKINALYAG